MGLCEGELSSAGRPRPRMFSIFPGQRSQLAWAVCPVCSGGDEEIILKNILFVNILLKN
jgi:hypothetical protein